MTCAEFKELAAAYALGALTPEERAACDAHLAGATHDGCFEALAEASETANALALSLAPVKPRADLWKAIEAETAAAGGAAEPVPRRARGSIVPWLLAAAMVLIVVWLGFSRSDLSNELAIARRDATKLADERAQCTQQLDAARDELKLRDQAVAMLQSPTGRLLLLTPTKDAPPSLHATAIYDVKDKHGMLIVAGLDKPADKDFELWVINGNQAPRAAGLLRKTGAPSLVAAIDPQQLADGADKLVVTLEPAGGGPAPRGPAVLSVDVPKT